MEANNSLDVMKLLGYAQFFLAPLLTFAVSIIYFLFSPKSQPLLVRLLASAHGAVIAIIFFLSLTLSNLVEPSPNFGKPFFIFYLALLALIVASLFLFKGRKIIHGLQVVNLLGLVWTYFIGGMAITGVWL
jgi:hypothetical protein